VADVRIGSTPTVIKRDAVSRKLDIEASISGRSLNAVVADVEQRLGDVKLPLEYHAQVIDETVSDEINGGQMLAFALAAAIAIFLLMQAAFRSWRVAVFAFLTLPVALAGGVLGALLLGGGITLGVLIGLIALFGLAARNGVVLIRHFQHLEQEEGEEFGQDLVRRGAQERLAPVLASAAAIGAAMLPFLIMGSAAGLEIVHPMAVVILCGLATSSTLILFVLPALYLRFGAGQPRTPDADAPGEQKAQSDLPLDEFGGERAVGSAVR
jgi:Cu/Ag efflux pump CusA